MSNSIATLVYRSRQILCKYMESRGKDASAYAGESIQDIENMVINDNVRMEFEGVYVIYYLGKGIRDSHIKGYIEELELKIEDELIVVIMNNPNDTIQKFQEYVFHNDKLFVNVISIEYLQFNILDHHMVPEHTILTEEEKEEVCNAYYITKDDQFPEISRFDPVARAIGLRPGQLCKILRNSKTAIQSEYYRLCI